MSTDNKLPNKKKNNNNEKDNQKEPKVKPFNNPVHQFFSSPKERANSLSLRTEIINGMTELSNNNNNNNNNNNIEKTSSSSNFPTSSISNTQCCDSTLLFSQEWHPNNYFRCGNLKSKVRSTGLFMKSMNKRALLISDNDFCDSFHSNSTSNDNISIHMESNRLLYGNSTIKRFNSGSEEIENDWKQHVEVIRNPVKWIMEKSIQNRFTIIVLLPKSFCSTFHSQFLQLNRVCEEISNMGGEMYGIARGKKKSITMKLKDRFNIRFPIIIDCDSILSDLLKKNDSPSSSPPSSSISTAFPLKMFSPPSFRKFSTCLRQTFLQKDCREAFSGFNNSTLNCSFNSTNLERKGELQTTKVTEPQTFVITNSHDIFYHAKNNNDIYNVRKLIETLELRKSYEASPKNEETSKLKKSDSSPQPSNVFHFNNTNSKELKNDFRKVEEFEEMNEQLRSQQNNKDTKTVDILPRGNTELEIVKRNVPTTFFKLLGIPESRYYFEEHLRNELNMDMIYFLDQVHLYKLITKNTKRVKEAKRLFYLYIEREATKELNLAPEIRDHIREELTYSLQHKKPTSEDLFNEAEAHVKNCLQKDSFQRFLLTPAFQNAAMYF